MGGSRVGSSGGFSGFMIPGFGFTIIAPEPLFNSARWLRIHRRVMKEVVKTVLWEWHQKTLPEHFKTSAKTKYRHKPRQESTRASRLKRYGHDLDLHQSGKTQRRMQSRIPRVTFSGSGDRYLQGRMKYRFPFPISRDASDPRHVTMAQMGSEIATWTESEKVWAINRVAELYAKEMEYELSKQPRLLKRYRKMNS